MSDEADVADNTRCPYCGVGRKNIEGDFEAHVLNCDPFQ